MERCRNFLFYVYLLLYNLFKMFYFLFLFLGWVIIIIRLTISGNKRCNKCTVYWQHANQPVLSLPYMTISLGYVLLVHFGLPALENEHLLLLLRWLVKLWILKNDKKISHCKLTCWSSTGYTQPSLQFFFSRIFLCCSLRTPEYHWYQCSVVHHHVHDNII